ncbi:MAG: beta-glucosidase [Treponematales bacterium]
MRHSSHLFLALLLAFVPGLLFPVSFADDLPPEELAAALLAAMSDEEALAQTFIFGWTGAGPSPLIMNWIERRHIGGVKVFGWNGGDTARLADTVGRLQTAALASGVGVPLLVATDQEGGAVRHVKGAASDTPGNMAIGASGRPADAYLAGCYTGRELALLGINMNFAPLVDLYTNRASALIDTRSFGSGAVNAGLLGAAFMRGLLAAGIIPTAKHFPGHGATDLDSHGALPRINAPFETLWERELVPFRMLAREGLPALMSGHLAFPLTEAGGAPASLSPWFLNEVLRGKMGYRGVVVTDDLEMTGAVVFARSVPAAAKRALMAGNDIILLSRTPALNDPVWTSLVNDMKREDGFRERVRAAALSVLTLKLTHLKGEGAVPFIPDAAKVRDGLPDKEGAAFFLSLAARSVTVVRGGGGDGSAAVFPLGPEAAGRVLLAGQSLDFFAAGKAAYPAAASYWYSAGTARNLRRYAAAADTIIFCLSGGEGFTLLEGLRSLGKRTIVLSALSPSYLDNLPWPAGLLAVYSQSKPSFTAAFSAMRGRYQPTGRLPFPPRR